MAHDYEDIYDLDGLGDIELRDLVRGKLDEHETVDADSITISVERGVVTLSGRIGTEGERRIAEHILTDVIGLTSYENNLVVDAIRRDEESEDIEEGAGATADGNSRTLGRLSQHTDEEAEHLEEDLEVQLYGAQDVQSAIEHGTPWSPPDSPTQEGLVGTDARPEEMGEDH
ncbi:MAG: BON domain-containing protein [Gemmatimonadota bacterium]|nr:BON domain-containing protein [Gemmatimonadota bacterium]